jgi:hypothetical protein
MCVVIFCVAAFLAFFLVRDFSAKEKTGPVINQSQSITNQSPTPKSSVSDQ